MPSLLAQSLTDPATLTLVVGALLVALIGFVLLARYGPRNTVITVAVIVYLAGRLIDRTQSWPHFVAAFILRSAGFIGALIGVLDAIRRHLAARAAARDDAGESDLTTEDPESTEEENDDQ